MHRGNTRAAASNYTRGRSVKLGISAARTGLADGRRCQSFKFQKLTRRLSPKTRLNELPELSRENAAPHEIITTLILAERLFQKSVGSQKLLRNASRYSGCPSARRAVRLARVDLESEQLCDRKSPRDAAWSPTRIQGARASNDRRMRQRRCRQGAGMLPRTRTRCSRSWGRNAVLPFAPNRRCARKPCLDPQRAPDALKACYNFCRDPVG